MKFKYNTTQEVYEYIMKSFEVGQVITTDSIVRDFKGKLDNVFVRKALSDISKEKYLVRFNRGFYVVNPDPKKVDEKKMFKNLNSYLKIESEEIILSSPAWLAVKNNFTQQSPFTRKIILSSCQNYNDNYQSNFLDIVNQCLEDGEKISSHYNYHNSSDVRRLVADYLSSLESLSDLDEKINVFNEEYGKYIFIGKADDIPNMKNEFRFTSLTEAIYQTNALSGNSFVELFNNDGYYIFYKK